MKAKNLPYETTDIKLGAAIICTIQGAHLAGIDRDRIVNSKKILLIQYPEKAAEELKTIEQGYYRKTLTVNVFHYNQALNQIRDLIRAHAENDGRRLQGIGDKNG